MGNFFKNKMHLISPANFFNALNPINFYLHEIPLAKTYFKLKI